SRATAITPLVQSGRLFLPERAPWLGTFKAQLISFPQGAHDDLVDTLAQALNYLRERREDQAMEWVHKLEEAKSQSASGSSRPRRCIRQGTIGSRNSRARMLRLSSPHWMGHSRKPCASRSSFPPTTRSNPSAGSWPIFLKLSTKCWSSIAIRAT